MKILIDTNIILDILQKRQPFFQESYNAINKAIKDDVECLLSASAISDIFYILRKALGSSKQAKEQIKQLNKIVSFADVLSQDINNALSKNMSDFEDALVDAVASRYEATYIITRNIKDFIDSSVPAISPKDFIKK